MRAAIGRLWAPIGTALVLLGAGAVLLSSAFDTPPRAGLVGRVVPVNAGARNPVDISAHNSPTVVRSPTDPRRLAISNRIDSPRYSCALHVSADGGATWSQTPMPAPRGETECYAPDVAFGADGTLYVSFVTLRGVGHVPNAAWLVTSKDGGRTLSVPRRVLGRLPFQVRLATDPRRHRRVYLTWLQGSEVGLYRFATAGAPIRTMRSDDGGATWRAVVQANSARRQRVVAPSTAVGPDGEVYVLYLDLAEDRLDYEGGHAGRGGPPYGGRWRLVLSRSRDGGATWDESVVEEALVPTERLVAFIPPFPALAVDAGTGRLYASFHDGRLGDPDVWLWSLERGAGDWQGPTRVNDTRRRDGTAQYLPKLAVSPGGRVDVVYYDRRADRRNIMNETSLQSSYDRGRTFTPRLRLSGDRAFSSEVGFGFDRGLPDLGSRLGLVSTDTRAIAVWSDTRAGTTASLKQDIARRFVAFSDPPRLSRPVEYLLRLGGLALAVAGLFVLARGLRRRGPARVAV